MRDEIKFQCARRHWLDGIEIRIWSRSEQSRSVAFVRDITFETIEEGLYMDPSLVLAVNEAQRLMDELWGCGLRPTEGTGSAGSLAATERHLADMRRLVFERPQP